MEQEKVIKLEIQYPEGTDDWEIDEVYRLMQEAFQIPRGWGWRMLVSFVEE